MHSMAAPRAAIALIPPIHAIVAIARFRVEGVRFRILGLGLGSLGFKVEDLPVRKRITSRMNLVSVLGFSDLGFRIFE
jgi:hypothetical protein